MIIKKISDKFEGFGALILSDKLINQLSRKEIIKIFEKKGMIIFRNFNIDPKKIIKITDRFTILQYLHSHSSQSNKHFQKDGENRRGVRRQQ